MPIKISFGTHFNELNRFRNSSLTKKGALMKIASIPKVSVPFYLGYNIVHFTCLLPYFWGWTVLKGIHNRRELS